MRPLTPWGLAVKKRLVERGMTTVDLAHAVGASQASFIRDMMYGLKPGRKYVGKIEQYLEMRAVD